MKQGRNISFYIEIVLMLIISVLAISILANAFSKSDLNSRKAKRLSDAVTLSASGAEAFLASSSEQELLKNLNETGNAELSDSRTSADTEQKNANATGKVITAFYDDDLNPDANGRMKMEICWDEEGDFVNGTVTVFYAGEEIYGLETGFSKEGRQ